MIGFSIVPATAIASGVFVEQEAIAPGVGTLKLPQKLALFGQYNAGKTVTPNTPRLLSSADEAASLYGVGSMLHLMARKAFAVGGIVPIYAFPLAPAVDSVAAQATITVSGPATSSGTIALFIGAQKVSVPILIGDSANAIASAIATKLSAAVNLPCTASPSGNIVTATAKWTGETGNLIDISVDLDTGDSLKEPDGVSLAISGFSGGSLDPATDDAFTAMGATFFTFVAYPYKSSAALVSLDAAFEARIQPDVKKPFVAIIGDTRLKSDYSDAVTLRNSPAETYVNVELSPSLTCEISAVVAAVAAKSSEANPARPWKNLILTGIRASSRPALTYAEHNTIQRAGGGTTDPLVGGTVKIHDLVTTYKTNALGAEDDSFRYPETIANMQAKIYSLDNMFSSTPFDRAIVVDDGSTTGLSYVVSPKRVKAFLLRLIDELWIANAWSKERDAIVESIVVEINSGNAGRIDVQLTDVMSAGLRIMAIKYQWAFSAAA
jgi:phage tail sheath gpL-like